MKVIYFCALSWKKKKKSSLKKKSFVPTETIALFWENIDLFNKEESEWIIPQGPIVVESYNIVLVKLDSLVEVHSSVLISVYFFQFINVCVCQREFRGHYLKIGL